MKNGIKTSNFEMVLHCSKKMEFFEIWFTHCIECAHEGCWELSIEYSMDAFALLLIALSVHVKVAGSYQLNIVWMHLHY